MAVDAWGMLNQLAERLADAGVVRIHAACGLPDRVLCRMFAGFLQTEDEQTGLQWAKGSDLHRAVDVYYDRSHDVWQWVSCQ